MRASCRYRAPNKKKGKVEEASEGLHAGGDNAAVAWQESEEDVLWVPPSGQTGTLFFPPSLYQRFSIVTLLFLHLFPPYPRCRVKRDYALNHGVCGYRRRQDGTQRQAGLLRGLE